MVESHRKRRPRHSDVARASALGGADVGAAVGVRLDVEVYIAVVSEVGLESWMVWLVFVGCVRLFASLFDFVFLCNTVCIDFVVRYCLLLVLLFGCGCS